MRYEPDRLDVASNCLRHRPRSIEIFYLTFIGPDLKFSNKGHIFDHHPLQYLHQDLRTIATLAPHCVRCSAGVGATPPPNPQSSAPTSGCGDGHALTN